MASGELNFAITQTRNGQRDSLPPRRSATPGVSRWKRRVERRFPWSRAVAAYGRRLRKRRREPAHASRPAGPPMVEKRDLAVPGGPIGRERQFAGAGTAAYWILASLERGGDMSIIDVRVENELGEEEDRAEGRTWLLSGVLSRIEISEFRLLKYLDLYGDTTFNRLQ